MLISGGFSMGMQKATTGSVDPLQLAMDMVPGGPIVQGLAGAGSAAYSYMKSPGPHNVAGLVGDVAVAGLVAVLPGPSAGGKQAIGAASDSVVSQGIRSTDDVIASASPKLKDIGPTVHDPSDIRFSQSSVNGAQEIMDSMRSDGWKGGPIDVVKMNDGKLTTIDNTRLYAAQETLTPVQANIHRFDDPLPASRAYTLQSRKGDIPVTWGEGALNRIGKHNSKFRSEYPFGSPSTEWRGN